MDPGVRCYGMKINHTGKLCSKYEFFLINRPFSHCKFPSSLRLLGNTISIRRGASGSKCTRCLWTLHGVPVLLNAVPSYISTVNCQKIYIYNLTYILIVITYLSGVSNIDINPSLIPTLISTFKYIRSLSLT